MFTERITWLGPTSPLVSGGQPPPHEPAPQLSVKLTPAKFWIGAGIGGRGPPGTEGCDDVGASAGAFCEKGGRSNGRYGFGAAAAKGTCGRLRRSPLNSNGVTFAPSYAGVPTPCWESAGWATPHAMQAINAARTNARECIPDDIPVLPAARGAFVMQPRKATS